MSFKIGIFTSGTGPTSRRLIQTIHEKVADGTIPNSEIKYVYLSQRTDESENGNLMLKVLEELKVTHIIFSAFEFEQKMRKQGIKALKKGDGTVLDNWRTLYDREIYNSICSLPVDAVIFIGYMWIASKFLCKNCPPMINLHPALPDGPKGTYQDVIWRLIADCARRSGVMMHLVTPELDRGPVVAYCEYSIRGGSFDPEWSKMTERLKSEPFEHIKKREYMENPLWKAIREEGVKREFPITIWTIKSIAEGLITIADGKIFDKKGQILMHGYNLTSEIDESLKMGVS